MNATTLHKLSRAELRAVFDAGAPFDPADVVGHEYLGVSLGMPSFVDQLAWKTFVKVFHRDGERVRGWNVRLKQQGIDGPHEPMRRGGAPLTFGHFAVQPERDAVLLDYGRGGNRALDPVRVLRDPVVAVRAGDTDLLLGYSELELLGRRVPTPSWFTLERLRPVSYLAQPHRMAS